MKIFSTWTGVLIVALLAVAMGAVAFIQHAQGQKPTAIASVIGLIVVAVLMARRIMRIKP
jgi:membrane protein DedA with SNARE-associated domain